MSLIDLLFSKLIAAHSARKAAKGVAAQEVDDWQQALLDVLDLTKEIVGQFRNDNVVKSVVRKKLLPVSVRLEGILRCRAGPRVAPHISDLQDVYEHVGELHEIYKPGSRAFTDEMQREIQESAASLAKEAENLRNALK